MPDSTSRLALVEPVGEDAPSEYRLAITANAETLNDAVLITEGTLVDRPAASSVAAGNEYYATDIGQVFKSNGSAWSAVITSAQSFKLQTGSVTASLGIGISSIPMTLPVAWTSSHVAFIASAVPASAATSSDFVMNSGPQTGGSNLTEGFCRISSSASQNWTISWISMGV